MRSLCALLAQAVLGATFVSNSANSQVDWAQIDERGRAWIEQSCATEQRMGPSYYFPCINRNIQAYRQAGPGISWGGMEKTAIEWIERSCQTERRMGPSYYYPCIQRNLSAAKQLEQFDDWYRLDKSTQEWIEGACKTEARMGPAYYYPCLTRNTYAVITPTPPNSKKQSRQSLSPCPPGTVENLKTTECENPSAPSSTVRRIQAGLNALGYNAGKADGRYGDQTRRAIVEFQRDNELTQSGEPSPGLLSTIERKAAAKANQPVKREPKLASSGSGFFITSSGHAITNAHVVEGCVRLSLADGSVGRVIDKQTGVDLALLKVDTTNEHHAKIRANDAIRSGEPVVAAGFPLAGLLAPQVNITTGVISSTAGLRNDQSSLQMTAPVQPGNSGGPLLDERGEVVGVVVSKLDALKVAGLTGDIPQNVNFAIKSSHVVSLAQRNGIKVSTGSWSRKYDPPTVGEFASKFTVQVMCWK